MPEGSCTIVVNVVLPESPASTTIVDETMLSDMVTFAVLFRIIADALAMSMSATSVTVIVSPALARSAFALSLDAVRFSFDGAVVSAMVTVLVMAAGTLPARSAGAVYVTV